MKSSLAPLKLFSCLVVLTRSGIERCETLYARSDSFTDISDARKAAYPGWAIAELLF